MLLYQERKMLDIVAWNYYSAFIHKFYTFARAPYSANCRLCGYFYERYGCLWGIKKRLVVQKILLSVFWEAKLQLTQLSAIFPKAILVGFVIGLW